MSMNVPMSDIRENPHRSWEPGYIVARDDATLDDVLNMGIDSYPPRRLWVGYNLGGIERVYLAIGTLPSRICYVKVIDTYISVTDTNVK